MTGREKFARFVYSLAWLPALPLAVCYLLWRSWRQPAYRRHLFERFGIYGDKPSEKPIWLHLVSVGETRGAQPLVAALVQAYPGVPLLITHMTPTGRETSEALFPDAWRAYLPYDHPWLVRRFLRHFRPRLAIIMETELWPNLIHEAADANVVSVIVNARLSARSLRKGERFGALISPALRRLDCLLAQTTADGERLTRLGRAPDAITGNLKFDVMANPAMESLGAQWRASIRSKPLVMLASSRDGEEAEVLDAWGADSTAGTRCDLVLVPRHPQRFDAVAADVKARGLARKRRSNSWQGPEGAVLIGDSMGEMAAYYALADVVIMGGSLRPFGGQNLIEPCAAGVPVIIGPHTENFALASELAIDGGAAIRVADAAEAVATAVRLASDSVRLEQMSAAARAFADAHRGANARTMARLHKLLR